MATTSSLIGGGIKYLERGSKAVAPNGTATHTLAQTVDMSKATLSVSVKTGASSYTAQFATSPGVGASLTANNTITFYGGAPGQSSDYSASPVAFWELVEWY